MLISLANNKTSVELTYAIDIHGNESDLYEFSKKERFSVNASSIRGTVEISACKCGDFKISKIDMSVQRKEPHKCSYLRNVGYAVKNKLTIY